MADGPAGEIWQTIPPEEKLEMMSRAHASGTFACLIAIVICTTVAVSLKLNWILWTSLLACPFIFQFSAGKTWRDLRPRTMLEYMAARSAARRYAFSHQAKNLGLQLMFRGVLTQKFTADQAQQELEAAVENNKTAAVWVALFNDAVVMMSEHPGGAKAHFVHVLNDKLQVESVNPPEDGGDRGASHQVIIESLDKRGIGTATAWSLTSRYPAALVVFDSKLRALMEREKVAAAKALEDLEAQELAN